MGRYISFAVLIAIIVVIGVLFYKVMIGFFVPVFLAAILVVVFRPLHRWVMAKVGEREHLAAGITSTLIILAVLLPTAMVITLSAVQGAKLFENFSSASIQIQTGLSKLRSNKMINLESPCASQLRTIHKKIGDIKSEIAKAKTYKELTDGKGVLAGSAKDIQEHLKQLIPRLIEYTRDRSLQSLVESRNKLGTPITQLPMIEKVFADEFRIIQSEIDKLLVIIGDESDEERQLRLPEFLGAAWEPRNALQPDELAIIKSSREELIRLSVTWFRSIQQTHRSLEGLSRFSGTDQDDDESNINSIKDAVDMLEKDYRNTRDTISGGFVMSFLRDIANPSGDQVRELTENAFSYIQPQLLTFTGDSAAFLLRVMVGCSILMMSLYFFLYDGPGIIRSLMELSPLDDRYELELLAEFDRISRAIVLATLLSALLQGLTAGVGYYVVSLWVELDSLLLLTVLTATCALIPFVGPAIIWLPVCIYLLIFKESPVAAGLLALWGLFVVGTVDNLVKMFVLHGQSQLHPLLALLSVLGGIQSLGPIGIVVGPMVVTLLQTLLGILRNELTQFKNSEEAGTDRMADETKNLSGLIRKVKMSSDPVTLENAIGPITSEPNVAPE